MGRRSSAMPRCVYFLPNLSTLCYEAALLFSSSQNMFYSVYVPMEIYMSPTRKWMRFKHVS